MADNDTSPISGVLAGLAVSDLGASTAWMSKVVGRDEDARPMEGLADWYLGSAGTVQLSVDADRAGGSMVTLVVADIVAMRDRLADVGIQLDFDSETSDKVRFGLLLDPDGNSVAIVEPKEGFNPQAAEQ